MAGGHAAGLTRRQREVWELLRQGLTNEEIAAQLGISPDGVKYHVADILRRLQVRNRYEAALVEPAAAGRSWVRALLPLPLLGKLKSHTLAYAASGAALAAVAAGIALLAWGVMRTHGDGAPLAGEPTPAHREQEVSYVRDGAIWVVPADGGAPQRFADAAPCEDPQGSPGGGAQTPRLEWSPDGQRLLCMTAGQSRTASGPLVTFRMAVWSEGGQLLRRFDTAPTDRLGLAWSPSSAMLIYATSDGMTFLDRDGKSLGAVTGAVLDRPESAGTVPLSSPLWSQDGTRFAYWLSSDGQAHVVTPAANGAADRPLLDLGERAIAWVLDDTAMLVAQNYAPPARDPAFPSYQVSLVNLTTGERQRRPELDNGGSSGSRRTAPGSRTSRRGCRWG